MGKKDVIILRVFLFLINIGESTKDWKVIVIFYSLDPPFLNIIETHLPLSWIRHILIMIYLHLIFDLFKSLWSYQPFFQCQIQKN